MKKYRILIDLHTHMLPGVDDGSVDIDMTERMIDMAWRQGIREIVFTPHYTVGQKNLSYTKVEDVYESTVEQLKLNGCEMKFYLGNEIYYGPSITDELKAGRIHTIAGTNYVLVEFGLDVSYIELMDAVRKLVYDRYIPIIAHIERYQKISKPEQYAEIKKQGGCIQINHRSLEGSMLNPVAKKARMLVKNQLADVVSTDSHNTTSRAPDIKKSMEWIAKNCSDEYATMILGRNQRMILDNEYIN